MIDFQTIAALAFIVFLTVFLHSRKKKIEVKPLGSDFNFSLYRTSIGLRLMDSIASRFRKLTRFIGYIGVAVGFAGMLLMVYLLVRAVFDMFFVPSAAPPVGIVLPVPVKIPGIVSIPFFYWILSIFVVAGVHEFAHGLIARSHSLKIKSSGFAFLSMSFRVFGIIIIVFSLGLVFRNANQSLPGIIKNFSHFSYSSPDFWLVIGIVMLLVSFARNIFVPIIPAAFVEPDEKVLKKRPAREQLGVYAAGSFSNIITAFLCLLVILFAFVPLSNSIFEPDGVKIANYAEGSTKYPAETEGIKIGEIVRQIDSTQIDFVSNLSNALKNKKPGEKVLIKTDKSSYEVMLGKNPQNESLAYLGAYLEQSIRIKDAAKERYGEILPKIFTWISGLFEMLFVLNLGIGLFNLLPFAILDGGRMSQVAVFRIFGKAKGERYWKYINMFMLFVLGIILVMILKNILVYFVS